MISNTLATAALIAFSTVGMASAVPASDADERRSPASDMSARHASVPASVHASVHASVPVPATAAATAAVPTSATAPSMMTARSVDVRAAVPFLPTSIREVVAPVASVDAPTVAYLDPAAEQRLIAAQAEAVAAQQAAEPVYVGADGESIDAQRLRSWLVDRESPLAEHAEVLVQAGLDHDVDPRLVVAIATKESSAGLRLPPGSHNAWGWGGSGAHGLAAWPSWPAAIDDFTERLGDLYDTDDVDERFAQRYCPPNAQEWLRTVRWVIQDI